MRGSSGCGGAAGSGGTLVDLYCGTGALGLACARNFDRVVGIDVNEASIADALNAATAALLRTRRRDEWLELFAGTDACVAPVLSLREAPEHPHNQARGTFIELGGVVQPGPVPRYTGTVTDPPRLPGREGEDGAMILAELGYDDGEIEGLLA